MFAPLLIDYFVYSRDPLRLGCPIPLKPTLLPKQIKEYSEAIDWRVIYACVVVVKLLLSYVDVS
jgi:hypothetical protein